MAYVATLLLVTSCVGFSSCTIYNEDRMIRLERLLDEQSMQISELKRDMAYQKSEILFLRNQPQDCKLEISDHKGKETLNTVDSSTRKQDRTQDAEIFDADSNNGSHMTRPSPDNTYKAPSMVPRKRLLMSGTSTSIVAFYSYLSKTEPDPGHHHTIVFDHAETNSGNAYSVHTGVFTAPEDGLYVFSYFITSERNGRIPLELVLNSKVVASSVSDAYSASTYGVAASTVVLLMKQGDKCFLRTESNIGNSVRGPIYSDDWSRSSFCGWKLSQ